MNISSICQRRIITIDQASTLDQAAGRMREHNVSALLVMSPTLGGARACGIVTERELTVSAQVHSIVDSDIEIGDLANHRIVNVSESDTLPMALAMMRKNGVRCLLVNDANQRLVGMLLLDHLMDACTNQMTGRVKLIRSGGVREMAAPSAVPATPASLRMPSMEIAA